LEGVEVLPIQEDSTALLLWALWIHYDSSKDIESTRPLYETFVLRAADFLLHYRDPETLLPIPSFDLWEERYGVHAYTAASVISGLRGAARFARLFSDLPHAEAYESAADAMSAAIVKHLYHPGLQRYARSGQRRGDGYELDEVVDVSVLALVTLAGFDPADDRVLNTVAAVREHLICATPAGGLARYSGDQYQREPDVPPEVPGNPWFISTLWLGEYEIARAANLEELRRALPYLEWCVANALPSGVFAEQVHPVTGAPLSVSPLTWSHSAFVWVVLAYVEKFQSLGGSRSGAAAE
jgi:GH15 family glucan-1,4-alpha-glucosidase